MADFPNIPKVKATLVDGNLRILRAGSAPKVTVLGVTDSADSNISVLDPILLSDDDNINMFDHADGTPSEISKGIAEARSAGADNIEVVVLASATEDDYNPITRYADLASAYNVLQHHQVQLVVPLGTAIDEHSLSSTQNFGWQLANFCYQQTKNWSSSHGFIGVRPPIVSASGTPTLAEVETWVAALETFDTSAQANGGADFTIYDGVTDAGSDGVPDTYAFLATSDELIPTGAPPWNDANVVQDKNNNPVDIGAYISVVAFTGKALNEVSRREDPVNAYYRSNGAAGYAGLVASLPSWIAPTNRVVGGYVPFRNFSYDQVNRLIGNRFVPFLDRPTKGLVVARGRTGAYNISDTYKSDYVNLSTVRIVAEAVTRVREVAEPFLGQPNNPQIRNALEAEIDAMLRRMQSVGALQRSDFNLVSTPSMQITGDIRVDLTLVPAFEIVTIEISTSLARE